MKILYAIQTTGNGHLARAQNIIPRLKQVADLDIITSGPKNDFLLEVTPIKHYNGLTFFYTDTGAVNWLKTIFLNNYPLIPSIFLITISLLSSSLIIYLLLPLVLVSDH